MKKVIYILLVLFSLHAAAQPESLIPLPLQIERNEGSFVADQNTTIVAVQPELSGVADYLQQQLLRTLDVSMRIGTASGKRSILLSLSKVKAAGQDEAYTLTVTPSQIMIKGTTPHGVFNGVCTCLQLFNLHNETNHRFSIQCQSITDHPRYPWRGLLLDESRHFFGKQTVKQLLDWMAFYKLNKFHWHLTDAHGWRLPIKAYPLLTKIGGIGNYTDPVAPAAFYTQDDIAEIVAYARERFIDVIPEVDMPGHARAANRGYPQYSGGGSAANPDFTFNPGLDSTYGFLTHILRETDALFPSQYIHIGGDEVTLGNEHWKSDAHVSKLMREQQLSSLADVEHYFIRRMADSVYSLQNKLLLWDEAADSGLPADKTILFWWRHDKPEQYQKILQKGYEVVLCPRLPFYFDFVQDNSQRYGRRWKGDYVTLQKLYEFSPDSITAKRNQRQVLGVQAALWTEQILNREKLQYMLFPRIAALAETAWNVSSNKNYDAFKVRLKKHISFYEKAQIYYYNPFSPILTPEPLNALQLVK